MAITDDKYLKKRAQLIERTARVLATDTAVAESLLSIPRQQSVRLNRLKAPKNDTMNTLRELGVKFQQSAIANEGLFIIEGMSIARDSALSADGFIYIQNAASWLPVVALDVQPKDTILDVCAAPGGKTSHIGQMTDNKAFITANDNSRPRLLKLQRNLERLGVEHVEYTLHDATRLSQKLPIESFDKILLDAPCSGEGMMTLDDKKGFDSWSVAHIKRLQQLQKKLIVQAWQLLKPGGTLVYSTCTMAPEENEAVIDYLLRHNSNAIVEPLDLLSESLPNRVDAVLDWNDKQYNSELMKALRLKPSKEIEAFFVVKLTKKPEDIV